MVLSRGTYEAEVSQDGGFNLSHLPLNTIGSEERQLSATLSNMLHGDPHAQPPPAAKIIHRLFLRCVGNESSPNKSGYFLRTLWEMVIRLVEQIPHAYEAHNTMLSLIMELKELPGDEDRVLNVSASF
jgi:hypothetical protein